MRCSNVECIPETGCDLGHTDLAACKNYQNAKTEKDQSEDTMETVRVPWTGRPLGERDIAFIAASDRPVTVSLIGPHDAGKTTLLGAIFLAVFDGFQPANTWQFAGSYSLSGWHDITARMHLDAEGNVGFPAHTPDRDVRVPGLLHLRLAQNRMHRNILLADAPGEWFSRWSRDPTADGSKGASWVVNAARRNLLIADSDALGGPDRFTARETFERIAGRLADTTQGRNVALVWTKSDVNIDESHRLRIEDIFKRHFSQSPIFHTQVPLDGDEIARADPKSLIDLMAWLVANPETKPLEFTHNRDFGDDPFLSFGGQP